MDNEIMDNFLTGNSFYIFSPGLLPEEIIKSLVNKKMIAKQNFYAIKKAGVKPAL
ncbi:hypothetical protein [Ferruginibacter sp. SUN106]|uniref:hypothetical protein n=1 Tax=Ferruginibacter sp. SUN106 TaxID=2978348 RepID=UPI003D3619B0